MSRKIAKIAKQRSSLEPSVRFQEFFLAILAILAAHPLKATLIRTASALAGADGLEVEHRTPLQLADELGSRAA